MAPEVMPEAMPDPSKYRICQRTLCGILGFSERTGSLQAKAGKLSRFEHGIPGCGRRKYSLNPCRTRASNALGSGRPGAGQNDRGRSCLG